VAAIESPLNIRITSSAEVDPSTLRPHPDNWRRHPNAQLGALEGALSEIGWVAPVTVNQTTGHMLDGHARVKIAIERGEALVPVNYVELTEAEELLFLATFDPLAEMAGTHAKELEAILERIGDVRSSHLDVLLDALRRRAGLAAKILTSRRGIGTQIDVTPFEMGEIRTLGHDGAHRVMCGDSTDREAVGRLLATIEPTLLVADPPTEGDEDVESAEAVYRAALKLAYDHIQPGAAFYCCSPTGPQIVNFITTLQEIGFHVSLSIAWVKDQTLYSRWDYNPQHEAILYGWKPGAERFFSGRGESTVWQIDRPRVSKEHPTMKPVELMARAIRNSSRRDEWVYDPFGGSGSTLLACETLGRRCAIMEKDPEYCGLIVRRYEELTAPEEEA
jgi:ParB-like chromosome segregation protein Spo0J